VGIITIDHERDERTAFEAFYRAQWPAAARWGAAIVGRADVGEELAQDVFARMASEFGRLTNPGGYLRRSVVNAARSWLRSEARARRREAAAADTRRTVAEPDLEVYTALDRLPERQRIVIVLRYGADWADGDIAAALGCPPSTVRSLGRRGLASLRERLTDE
jgi:RNA polymerase sigma factor (sigma-70 family)